MSRLAKKPLPIPQGATVAKEDGALLVKGPKGAMRVAILPHIEVTLSADSAEVKTEKTMKQARANSGTMWSLLRGALEGVTNGFSKVLELEGVGYRATMDGKMLVLNLGFANPVKMTPPEGISIVVEKNVITVSGISKELVGRVAAEIRAHKKPEPYKGKGIRYRGEVVRRKAGKKATGSTGAA